MSRVSLVDKSSATGAVAEQLAQIDATFGTVPAMFRAVANSPAALASMWGSFGAFGGGKLGAALSEQIAVAVANRNSCAYCLAAHTALGRKAGVTTEGLKSAQIGESDDPRVVAVLQFTLRLVDNRGQLNDSDIQQLRDHGWGDDEIVEVIGQVALNLFTNYINIALDVPVDFPKIAFRTL